MDADQIPAELVEAAARAWYGRYASALPFLDAWDDLTPEYRAAHYAQHRASLAAVYGEIQARALQEARHAVRAMTPAPNSRLTWEGAQSKAARTLLEMEKTLRTPDADAGGGERG